MQAVIHSAFGSPADVLSVATVDRPSLPRDEVLVRVRAVGIAKGNWLITQGLPYIARPMYGWRTPRQRVAGLQFSGRIEAVGPDVAGFRENDPVFGFAAGSLAEFVAVSQRAIVAKPAGITFEQAAAAPIPGVTALQALRLAQVQRGDRVLVIGASGGVGSFAVQIAKAREAVVTGVASAPHLATVRSFGADHVINYLEEDPTSQPAAYDVILDIAGNRPVASLRHALTERGRLIIVGGTGSRWTMGFERTVGAMLLAPFVRQRISGLLSTPNRGDLAELAMLLASGKVVPAIETSYPLHQSAEAIEHVGGPHGHGSPVVTV